MLLYLDEIQYFNKKQQQTLLEHIENGRITLIASTTENPYFYVYNAILSRSTVFEFKSVEAADIEPAVERAFCFLERERSVPIRRGGRRGQAHRLFLRRRRAQGYQRGGIVRIGFLSLGGRQLVHHTGHGGAAGAKSAMRYDREGDEHYDILSAYQKSMRGSDPNAALHYLARLLDAGDLPSACRRLMVCACEDVGLAYPMIIPIVKAAVDAALQVGLPEARFPWRMRWCWYAAPKSNSAYAALDAAMEDIPRRAFRPHPTAAANKHFDGADNPHKGQFYQYPHEFPNCWVDQQYLPDVLKDRVYYIPGDNKTEQAFKSLLGPCKGGRPFG